MSDSKPKVVPVRGFKGGDPVAIGKLGGRPKGTKNKKRLINPLADLPPRKARYLENRVKGMTKIKAAIAAGYASPTANCITRIETPDVKEAFKKLMQAAIPSEKIVQRINEGMDATDTKFFTKDGVVVDQRDVPVWDERRKAAELAAEMSDRWNPKQDVEVGYTMSEETARRLLALSVRLGFDQLPAEQLAELRRSYVSVPDQTPVITGGCRCSSASFLELTVRLSKTQPTPL